MKDILNSLRLEEMFGYLEYGKSLVFIFIAAIVITLLLHNFFNRQRWLKYMPGLAMMAFGLYSLSQIDISSNTFLEDNTLTGFVTGVAGGLATLLFGLILGVFSKPKKVKKGRRSKVNQEDTKIEEE